MEIDAGPGASIFLYANDVVRSFNDKEINSLFDSLK